MRGSVAAQRGARGAAAGARALFIIMRRMPSRETREAGAPPPAFRGLGGAESAAPANDSSPAAAAVAAAALGAAAPGLVPPRLPLRLPVAPLRPPLGVAGGSGFMRTAAAIQSMNSAQSVPAGEDGVAPRSALLSRQRHHAPPLSSSTRLGPGSGSPVTALSVCARELARLATPLESSRPPAGSTGSGGMTMPTSAAQSDSMTALTCSSSGERRKAAWIHGRRGRRSRRGGE